MAGSPNGARLQFRLLGRLEITADGRSLPLAGAKQRALLAALLLRANEVVSTDQLVDDLWDEQPPPTAIASLRVSVSKLRRLFEEAAGQREMLETLPGGYRLRLAPAQLDINRFEELLDRADRERSNGDAKTASGLLYEALALWQGPALADFAYEPFAATEINRLEERKLTAIEARIDADLELGRHAALVPELEGLIALHPLRERFRAQLMLALYRSGRQADALDVYHKTRRALVEQLGIEPGPGLQELEKAILNQDPELGFHAPSSVGLAPRRHRVSRRSLAFAAGGAAILVAAISAPIVLLTRGGSGADSAAVVTPRPVLPTYSVTVIDPAKNAVAWRVPLNAEPTRIAVGQRSVWVTNARDQTVLRIDPQRRRVERTLGIPLTPGHIAIGQGAVWVLGRLERSLVQIVPTVDAVRTIELPRAFTPPHDISVGDPSGIAVGSGAAWVEDGDSRLFRVDAVTRGVKEVARLGSGVSGVAFGWGSVWVTKGSPPTLYRIDPRTTSVRARIPIAARGGVLAPYPIGVAAGGGGIWVLNGNTGTVTRIDPELDAVRATVARVSQNPTRIVAGAGAVWVADNANDAVLRVDPEANKVVKSIPVGGRPTAIAAGGGLLWVGVDSS